jgi:hypothetical protein
MNCDHILIRHMKLREIPKNQGFPPTPTPAPKKCLLTSPLQRHNSEVRRQDGAGVGEREEEKKEEEVSLVYRR